MFYPVIKIAFILALKIFCRKIDVRNGGQFKNEGPILITANHPNSFLDAIIIGVQFKHPVHFLARGDAFNKPIVRYIFGLLNMIPVYRLSEGKENLSLNEETFRRSKKILAENGIVLIFIEGISLHKHVLQPFKKGAARIALESIDKPNFRIMPLGIAYSSFVKFGKAINIVPGEPIPVKELLPFDDEAKNMRYFNERIYAEIDGKINVPELNNTPNKISKYLFFLPGIIGVILHMPLYAFLKRTIKKKTRGTVFYDSVLFGSLLLLYPMYLLLLLLVLFFLNIAPVSIIIFLLAHPLTAWVAVRWNAAFSGYSKVSKQSNIIIAS